MGLIITTITFYRAASVIINLLWACRPPSFALLELLSDMWLWSEEGEAFPSSSPTGILILVTDSSLHSFGRYAQASQMVHCPDEPFVDHCAVYTTLIFGHAAPDPQPPSSYTVKDVWCWGGVVPTLGLDQRDLSEGGSCKWRMVGAGGGGMHSENCWQLDLSSLAWPYLSRHRRYAFSTVTAGCYWCWLCFTVQAQTHTDVILTTFWKPARARVCTHMAKIKRMTWKEKAQVRES